MNFSKFLPVAGLTCFLLAGCAGSRLNPNITVYDQDSVSDRPVELPGNYNIDNLRRLTLAVMPGSLTSNAFNTSNMKYMSLRLQSELSKIRRFSLAALHGTDVTALQNLEDLGEVELTAQDAPTKIDLLAGWNFNIHAEEEIDGRDKVITFICTVNVTCKDLKSGKIKFSKDLDFRIGREQRLDRAGSIIGGFAYRSKTDVQGLMQDIATQAAIRIANELGNEYPIGGRVTGLLGTEMMTLDVGTEQGIDKDMQMVVFTKIGGVDVPLGNAVASPSVNSSQLTMWRLNDDNKYAEQVLEQMEADPNWITKHKLYAVGYGMAVPPEWQTKGLYLPGNN